MENLTIVPFTWKTQKQRDQMLTRLVQKYAHQPKTRMAALKILQDCKTPEREPIAAAQCLLRFIRANYPYRMEAGEQIVLPNLLLDNPGLGGDCDDLSMLLASLLASMAWQVRLNYWRRAGGPIDHVSVGILSNGSWVNLDPITDNKAGWKPEGYLLVPGKTIPTGGSYAVGAVEVCHKPPLWPVIAGSIAGAILAMKVLK